MVKHNDVSVCVCFLYQIIVTWFGCRQSWTQYLHYNYACL